MRDTTMTLLRYSALAGLAAFAACAHGAPQPPPGKPPSNANCNAFRQVPIEITDALLRGNDAPELKQLVTSVCREDMIGWHFVNVTSRRVDIRLSDFHACGNPGDKVKAVKFKGGLFDDDSDESVAPGRSVTLVGRIKGDAPACADYTIRLNDAVHDPRLQITDPG